MGTSRKGGVLLGTIAVGVSISGAAVSVGNGDSEAFLLVGDGESIVSAGGELKRAGKDVFLFGVSVCLNVVLFFGMQVFVFRGVSVKRLGSTLNRLIVLSCVVTLPLTFVLFRHSFSSFEAYAVSAAGCFFGSIFLLGFYSFSGPICSDRSPSAHMAMVLLEHQEKGLSEQELKSFYPYERVFDRRLKDFREAGIIEADGDQIRLTRKGTLITRYYVWLIHLLRMRRNF